MEGLVKILEREIARVTEEAGHAGGKEQYNGCTVEDAINAVDLTVAYSPVIDRVVRVDRGYPVHLPIPVRVDKGSDGRYALMYPESHTWRYVTERELKEMRARYLLFRGHLVKWWDRLSYPEKREAAALYFDGSMAMPEFVTRVFRKIDEPDEPQKPQQVAPTAVEQPAESTEQATGETAEQKGGA